MSSTKEKVLQYLKSHPNGCGPTEIGLHLGKSYASASSSVMPALKAFVEDGIVIKKKISGKVLYFLSS